jgi:hypothetical protein
MTRVRRKCLRNDKQCVSEGRYTPLRFTLDCLLELLTVEMSCACDLESTSTWYDASVYDHVVHTPQTVANGVLDLSNGVCVWALDK